MLSDGSSARTRPLRLFASLQGAQSCTSELAAPFLAGLFKMSVCAHLAHYALFVELLFQPTERLVHRLTLPNFNFGNDQKNHTPFNSDIVFIPIRLANL